VHINCPLREPLAPQPGKTLSLDFDPDKLLESLAPQRYAPPTPDIANLTLPREVRHGLIVAGTTNADDDNAARASLWKLAARTGWPVLADCLGPWRAGDVPQGVVRIGAYDAILADDANRERLAPDFVLQIGPLPTSKNLRSFLTALDSPTLVAAPTPANLDPLHVRAQAVQVAPEKLELLPLPVANDSAYAASWAELDRLTRARLNAALDAETLPTGGAIVREVYRALPASACLSLANSLTVRHAERFAECGHALFRVFVNRGANGIDGTIATALGASYGSRGVLITGDLAFLYDAGSLAIARQIKGSLTIVLIDNRGGGIFSGLPVATLGDPAFEKYFATPQDTDIAKLADAYGASFENLAAVADLDERLGNLPASGVRILRLETRRS
jgi:2-succinyl-5-enolpyruvyl-6-hydroxy-3-cyclohexene-1-carboxylate synthase